MASIVLPLVPGVLRPALADPPTPPDYVTPVTALVSVNSQGAPGGAGGPVSPTLSSISRDGRYVAFSTQSALVASDTDGLNDVYRADVSTDPAQIELASSDRPGCVGGENLCPWGTNPAISADGRYVAFVWRDPVSQPGADTNRVDDVYVRDMTLQVGGITLVSHAYGSTMAASATSYSPSVSGGGDFVVFTSLASNLIQSGDTNNKRDVFIWTRSTGAIERISLTSAGAQLPRDSSNVVGNQVVSDDGRYVVFASYANEIGNLYNKWEVFRRDRTQSVTTLVAVLSSDAAGNWVQPSDGATITADGRYVAFYSKGRFITGHNPCPAGTGSCQNVWTRDMDLGPSSAGAFTLISSDGTGAPPAALQTAAFPAISADGRYVVFDSDSAALVAGDTNGVRDVFSKDRATGAIQIVSATSGSQDAGDRSQQGSVSGDGRYTSFDSNANGLISPQPSNHYQVYRRYAPPPVIPPGQQLGPCRSTSTHGVKATWCQADPVNTATGNYFSSITDAALPGIGIAFSLSRTYNSADPRIGPFGRGWSFSYDAYLEISANQDVVLHAEDGQQLGFTRLADGTYLPDYGVRDRLVKEPDGTYTLVRTDQVTYRFDASGKLTSLRDRNAQGLSFSYTSGKLTAITDSVGRQIAISYTGSVITQISLPGARQVSYAYSGDDLSTVTDLRGGTITYAYDGAHLLDTITDQDGHTLVDNAYDAQGRVISQTDGRGNTSTFSYAGETTTFTDARGKVWRDIYSGGRLVQRIDPLGGATTYHWDISLNLTTTIDPRGNVWTATSDASGNLLSSTDPLGNTTTNTYTAGNDLATTTDPRGNTTSFGYDASGDLVSITRPGGVLTTFGRDPATGLLTSVTDPNDETTTYAYDSGNLVSVTDPLGNVATMAYDASGRITSRVDPRGNAPGADPAQFTWTFTYDASDHLLTSTDPLGGATTLSHDPAGNLLSRTDANSYTTSYAYDPNGNLSSVTAPGGAVTSYTYDPNNNLLTRTDPNSHTTSYAYDDANRLASLTDPLGNTTSLAYDPAGNLATRTTPVGEIAYAYDAANRLSGIDYSGQATPDVGLSYDAAGNRIGMSDGADTVSYAYDALGRLTSSTRGADTFTYGYDDAGNLTSRTYPDSTQIIHAYDGANRMSGVTTGGATITLAYDAAGNLVSTTRPGGVDSTYTFDRAGRLTGLSHTMGQSTYSAFTYALDPVGNPTRITTPGETIDMTYDARDRLLRACYTPTCSGQALSGISYTYDGVGNRLSETRYGISGSSTTTSAYDAADRLTQAGSTTYTYDDAGNQLSAGSRTFAYDLQNRLISTTSGGITESYAYDGDGNRLSLSQGGQLTTTYLWDANAPLPELVLERDGTGALLRRYTYGASIGQVPLAMRTGGSDHYLLGDGLGSVADVIASDGAPEWSYTYEPYGAIRAAVQDSPSAPVNLLRFTGQLLDPTIGNYHLRARGYDPSTGRFLQADPVASPSDVPLSSTYAYVRGRPTISTDPSGLWCLIHDSDGGCLGAGLVKRAWHMGRLVRNAPQTALAWGWAEATSGGKAGCHWQTGLMLECSRSAAWANGPLGVLAVGNAVINEGDPLPSPVLAHETKHADQWAILGPDGFVSTWLFSTSVSYGTTGTYACGNFIEWWAGLEDGGYGCEAVGAIAK